MHANRTTARQGLDTDWERRARRTAQLATAAAVIGSLVLVAALIAVDELSWLVPPVLIAGVVAVQRFTTRKLRRRRAILSTPFPPKWEVVLQQEVVFFRALDEAAKQVFRRELQVFLGEKRITGIQVELDDTTRVLTAASAIIPIFGFPQWEWDQISEVLIYPGRFDSEFGEGDGTKSTLGMVGTGTYSRLMILSKPDLLAGFRNAEDKRNVGVHEFAHLVDKTDGEIDGLPGVGLERDAIGPWLELVRRKMAEMARGDSDIDPYGLTNESEFFAVATEYFFERPGLMERRHPELYAMLAKAFNQDLLARGAAFSRERKRGHSKLGRNSRCPCGSGLKYKKCCL